MVGVIKSVSPGGGILVFIIKREDNGKLEQVLADNGPAIRAFDAAFGGVITAGHTFNPDAIVGKRIDYRTDEFGLMVSFEPA